MPVPTRIGTPLGPDATRVMLLGAGELGKEVAIAFQRLGVEVIAVDRYADAPAHQVAHRSHVIDMTDPAALKALIATERPDFVVPEIEAIATDALAEIEAASRAEADAGRAGRIIEIIPTAKATQLTMNREGIRRLAAEELGLPTSPFAFADSLKDLTSAIEGDGVTAGIGFPCVVKPVMSSSGKGQSTLRSADDVAPAWEMAQSGGRVKGGRVIVEGFVEFDYEITLLTVRAVGESGEVETFFCEPIGHRQESGDYVESWQPQPMSPVALAAARELADKITTALGYGGKTADGLSGRGIFGVELFVRGDEVLFSEVSPRPHDTGLVTLATQRLNEFELHARAILGLPVDTSLRSPGASAVIYGGLDEQGIGFEDLDAALRVPGSELRLFGKPESFTRRRMGVAVVAAADPETARQRAKESAGHVHTVSSR